MNLKDWAAEQGVAYVTARRWFAAGLLPVPAHRVGGLILIGEPVQPGRPTGSTVVYARVSSSDQKADLDRQVARITTWATDRHLFVDRVVTEVGSARSGQLRKFPSLLGDESVATIVASTATGSRVSGRPTSKQHCQRRVVGCWSWTLARLMTIWRVT
jgi:predicted site-specific integrase-resolvase